MHPKGTGRRRSVSVTEGSSPAIGCRPGTAGKASATSGRVWRLASRRRSREVRASVFGTCGTAGMRDLVRSTLLVGRIRANVRPGWLEALLRRRCAGRLPELADIR
jgi:hypothetical protein